MVIVCFPPMRRSGYVFSFGSGFVGQLALGEEYYSPTPKLVQSLVDMNVTAKYVLAPMPTYLLVLNALHMFAHFRRQSK